MLSDLRCVSTYTPSEAAALRAPLFFLLGGYGSQQGGTEWAQNLLLRSPSTLSRISELLTQIHSVVRSPDRMSRRIRHGSIEWWMDDAYQRVDHVDVRGGDSAAPTRRSSMEVARITTLCSNGEQSRVRSFLPTVRSSRRVAAPISLKNENFLAPYCSVH